MPKTPTGAKRDVRKIKPQAELYELSPATFEVRDSESMDLLGCGSNPKAAWADARKFLSPNYGEPIG